MIKYLIVLFLSDYEKCRIILLHLIFVLKQENKLLVYRFVFKLCTFNRK